ncbi:alpha/beta fold hydrolase [Nocardia sp. CT2-14]|uniref:Alpha/beta fold hydrolase n=2 Tax=Nocardia aurantiaca TaxID=2675850 RepID=A0A6I3KU91_9NOCA|nr:alpha/beta fold hydrolase [Nocardia aurantiaca]
MRELTVGAATVPYRVMGAGRPLVLVHGGGPGAKAWDGVAGAFADANTIALPNLSGSDLARDDDRELTVELLAEQVAAVITDLGAGPADVVGHSLGAVVVAALAALRPDLVRRAVLVAGFAGPGDDYTRHAMTAWRDLLDDADTFARFSMLLAFSRAHLGSIGRAAVDELARAFRSTPGRRRQIELALRLDIRDLLPRIQAPTLVIGGTYDGLAAVENSREVAALVPRAAYRELDSGHVVMAERPQEFVRLVRDFIQ